MKNTNTAGKYFQESAGMRLQRVGIMVEVNKNQDRQEWGGVSPFPKSLPFSFRK